MGTGAAPAACAGCRRRQDKEPSSMATFTDFAGAVETGGLSNAPVSANGGSAQVVKGSPGRLCLVTVTASGTAAGTFYDNASAASGTKLLVVPANAAVGAIYQLGMPAANGITFDALANAPSLTVGFN